MFRYCKQRGVLPKKIENTIYQSSLDKLLQQPVHHFKVELGPNGFSKQPSTILGCFRDVGKTRSEAGARLRHARKVEGEVKREFGNLKSGYLNTLPPGQRCKESSLLDRYFDIKLSKEKKRIQERVQNLVKWAEDCSKHRQCHKLRRTYAERHGIFTQPTSASPTTSCSTNANGVERAPGDQDLTKTSSNGQEGPGNLGTEKAAQLQQHSRVDLPDGHPCPSKCRGIEHIDSTSQSGLPTSTSSGGEPIVTTKPSTETAHTCLHRGKVWQHA